MGSLQVSKPINASIDRVFNLISDIENAPNYIKGIESIEVLTEGPIRVGSRWRETRTIMGRKSTEEMTVVQFKAPIIFAAKCKSCGALYESEFRCKATNNETLVTLSLSWKANSLMAKIMAPLSKLMSSGIKKCLEDDLEDIKKAAETVVLK